MILGNDVHKCRNSYLHWMNLWKCVTLVHIHICTVVFSWQFCSCFCKFIFALLDFLCKLFMLVQFHFGTAWFLSLHPQPSVPETNANKSKILRFLDILFHKFIQSSESGWKKCFLALLYIEFWPSVEFFWQCISTVQDYFITFTKYKL